MSEPSGVEHFSSIFIFVVPILFLCAVLILYWVQECTPCCNSGTVQLCFGDCIARQSKPSDGSGDRCRGTGNCLLRLLTCGCCCGRLDPPRRTARVVPTGPETPDAASAATSTQTDPRDDKNGDGTSVQARFVFEADRLPLLRL